jgi:hypothetical protein
MEENQTMSLLTESMEACVMIDKTTVSDGYGGYYSTWAEGAEFQAAITFDSSMEARTAEKAGVTSLYTVTTDKALILAYHDVFKRLSDEKIFRVTSDGDDKSTPASATLNMRQVTAEEFDLNG